MLFRSLSLFFNIHLIHMDLMDFKGNLFTICRNIHIRVFKDFFHIQFLLCKYRSNFPMFSCCIKVIWIDCLSPHLAPNLLVLHLMKIFISIVNIDQKPLYHNYHSNCPLPTNLTNLEILTYFPTLPIINKRKTC